MRWHASTSKPVRKKAGASSGLSIFSIATSKPRRRLQETEVYSKLYYKDRILPAVQDRLKTAGEQNGPLIKLIKEVTRELFADEDAETKAIVAKEWAALPELPDADANGEDGGNGLQRTPQQYQRCVCLRIS